MIGRSLAQFQLTAKLGEGGLGQGELSPIRLVLNWPAELPN